MLSSGAGPGSDGPVEAGGRAGTSPWSGCVGVAFLSPSLAAPEARADQARPADPPAPAGDIPLSSPHDGVGPLAW